jgi:hypothetical protein
MQSQRRTSKIKGISRMDFARATGWLVRVYRQGQTHTKFFSDGKYEGQAQALQQAIAYKTGYERQHPPEYPPDGPRPPFRRKPQRNSKTGINGVSETVHRTRTGERRRCFSVYYTLGGAPRTKRFYLDDYGSRVAALEEARQFRKEMEREMWREYQRRLREGGYLVKS